MMQQNEEQNGKRVSGTGTNKLMQMQMGLVNRQRAGPSRKRARPAALYSCSLEVNEDPARQGPIPSREKR